MTYNSIRLEQQQGVAILTLDRPDRLNSFTTEMHGEVRHAMTDIREEKSIRCLLLTGAGRSFCAGQDLNDRAVTAGEAAPDLSTSIRANYNPLIRTIMDLEIPVICAVNGVAAGAGANIALACDIVLAARSASFIQGFSKIGLIPDSGGTWTLPRLVGRARAMGLALLSDKLSAEKAEQWGMIWRAIDDDKLMEEAMTLATHLALQPTRGLALTKQAINAAGGNSLEQQLELECKLQEIAGRSLDYREGVAAFMEKRPPLFKGE